MYRNFFTKAVLCLFCPSLLAAPTISHSNITPWDDAVSAIEKKFEPAVRFSGCQPYPVINHVGEISGGLKPTGTRTQGCSDISKRQVQIRTACFVEDQTDIAYGSGNFFIGDFGSGEMCAVMYSYYFAKDVGAIFGIGGHRHDWESVVVWIRDGQKVVGVSYSGHGQFQKLRGDDADRIDSHPKVDYTYRNGTTEFTHSMREGTSSNSFYVTGLKVNSWSAMALDRPNLLSALEEHDFGNAIYPQENTRFAIELNRAWNAAWKDYEGMTW